MRHSVLVLYAIIMFFGMSTIAQELVLNQRKQVLILNDSSTQHLVALPKRALEEARSALSLSQQIGYLEGELEALKNVAIGFHHSLIYDSSLLYLRRAKNLATHLGDSLNLSLIFNNLGNIYHDNKQYDLAEENYLNSYVIGKAINSSERKAKALGNLGIIAYSAYNDLDKSLKYFTEALGILKELKDTEGQINALTNIAAVHFWLKQYDQTITYNLRALKLELAEGKDYKLALTYENLGEVHQVLGQFDSAHYYYHKSLEIGEKLQSSERIGAVYKRVASLYLERGLFRQAYDQLLVYDVIRDSINQSVMDSKLERIESIYNEEVSGQKISLLEAENQLRKEQVANQRFELHVFVISVLFLTFLVFILIIQLRKNNKTSMLLMQKTKALTLANEGIEGKNKMLSTTIAKLEATQGQLVESEKLASVGILISGIAHELNNPLNFISGVIDPLKSNMDILRQSISEDGESKETFEDIDEMLNIISTGSQKSVKIIRSLLNISPRNRQSPTELVQLVELVESKVTIIQKSNKAISFHLDIDEDLVVEGNPLELRQVFTNVLDNAVDAIPVGREGVIEVGAIVSKVGMSISVKDNGNGIDNSTIGNVFDPFFTTKAPGEGTGLGLYMARSIIAKYNGTISLSKNQSSGCTLTIRLPIPTSTSSGT